MTAPHDPAPSKVAYCRNSSSARFLGSQPPSSQIKSRYKGHGRGPMKGDRAGQFKDAALVSWMKRHDL